MPLRSTARLNPAINLSSKKRGFVLRTQAIGVARAEEPMAVEQQQVMQEQQDAQLLVNRQRRLDSIDSFIPLWLPVRTLCINLDLWIECIQCWRT
jgi:hypothetical protein